MALWQNKLIEGFKNKKKTRVENSTSGKIVLAENDLHAMKVILYDTGMRVVPRWPLKRIWK